MFLDNVECGGKLVLQIIKFIFSLLDIVLILVPIGLIIMVMIDFAKNVIANNGKDMNNKMNIAFKRIIFCMAIFLIKPIVKTSISLLGDMGVDYAECINISQTGDLNQYQTKFEDEKYKVDINENFVDIKQKENQKKKANSFSYSSLEPLSEYNLNAKGLKKLETPLTNSQVNQLNNYIIKEVDKAGYGTGDGVAAAGQALAYWFEKQGLYINYYRGGGHEKGNSSSFVGANKAWGTYHSEKKDDNPNKHYGMDCSGFVSWAIRNGCSKEYGSKFTIDMDHGPHISIREAKPGDLMLHRGHHVRLVVKNNGDGSVITAESTSGNGEWGLIFTKRSDETNYKFVDMSNYYKTICKKHR